MINKFLIGVSILPALAIMPAVADVPAPVDGVLNGVNVSGETGTQASGRLYNLATDNNDLSILNSSFSDNTGTIAWTTGPGADSVGNTLTISHSSFTNNTSANNGTVGAGSYGKALSVKDSIFSGNTANFGGAVFTGAKDVTVIESSTFTGNNAVTTGGAIYANSDLSIVKSTFSGNSGQFGGAGYGFGNTTIDNSTFQSNEAFFSAGAFGAGGDTTIKNSTFKNNIVGGEKDGEGNYTYQYESGGKTYGTESGAFGIASGGVKVNIEGSSFEGNSAFYGGAIGNGSFATVKKSEFKNNYGVNQGGAIINFLFSRANGETVDNVKLTVDDVLFENNSANAVGGAISTFSMGNINKARFIGNSTESETFGDGGGALFVGAESITKITNSVFEGNTSASSGGAIMTRSANVANNAAAKLDITGTTFAGNTAATTGGALDTYFYNSQEKEHQIYVANSTFEKNTATQGGAIFNHGLEDRGGNKADMYLNGISFNGNTATDKGGAIYNESSITLTGTNTFTGNKANGKANDIHNLGTVTVASGTTTLDGGITGDGDLVVANGATLNIGTAAIAQNTITLNGNMLATLRSGDAQITAGTFDGTGKLTLTMKEAGTYKVFGDKSFANVTWDESGLTTSSPLYNLTWDGGNVTATRKSTTEIAEDNNLSQESATMVSNLTDSSSEKLNDLAVKMQEKLAEATDDASKAVAAKEVEHAAKAIHPETESVTQSVATAVQTTVTNLASARMAAPMVGRNGGDVEFTSGGVWAQGLFNKSKQHDAFKGYTRGIAAGLDGTINKDWTIGAGYSYAHSDINGTARDTEIDSNTVFIYGQYKPAQWYVNAVANYTWSDFSEHSEDSLVTVKADYDVDSFGGTVATGYDFDNGITPELGLRYMHVNADDYTNSMGVKTSSKDTDFMTGVLGAKYAFNVVADEYTTFVPQLHAAVKYDILSDKSVATVTMPGIDSYTLQGERLSRVGGEFGIGLGMKHRGVDFSINYDIDVRKDYTSQTGMLKFRYNF